MISRLLRALLTLVVLGVATIVVLNHGTYVSMLPEELFEWSSKADSVQLTDTLRSEEPLVEAADTAALQEPILENNNQE